MPRFTIDVDEKFAKMLDEIAESRHSTKAEAIRVAVASYSFLKKQIDDNSDRKISITNAEDRVIKDVQLP